MLGGGQMLAEKALDIRPRLTDPRGQEKTASNQEAVNENGLPALTEQEKINLSSGKKNKIISTFQDTVAFIKNALADKQTVDRAYLGKIPAETASRTLCETGVDISGYNKAMKVM